MTEDWLVIFSNGRQKIYHAKDFEQLNIQLDTSCVVTVVHLSVLVENDKWIKDENLHNG